MSCMMEECKRMGVLRSYVMKQADGDTIRPCLCETCYQIVSRMCKHDSMVTLRRHYNDGLDQKSSSAKPRQTTACYSKRLITCDTDHSLPNSDEGRIEHIRILGFTRGK